MSQPFLSPLTFKAITSSGGVRIGLVVRHEKELGGVVNDLDPEDAITRPFILNRRETIDRISIENDVEIGQERERTYREQEHKELDEAAKRFGELARVHDRYAVEEGMKKAIADLDNRLLLLLLGGEWDLLLRWVGVNRCGRLLHSTTLYLDLESLVFKPTFQLAIDFLINFVQRDSNPITYIFETKNSLYCK